MPQALIHEMVKEAVVSQQLTPVFLGTAYRNKGVQPLLDAVVRYLPSPLDCAVKALAHGDQTKEFRWPPTPTSRPWPWPSRSSKTPTARSPSCGSTRAASTRAPATYNQRTGRKERFGRIVRMHADQREDIDAASAGDIVAVLGVDSASGDTYASEYPYCTLQSMFVPEPVIKMAIAPVNRDGADRLGKALQRFRREDPTLHVSTDEETSETIIAGMGELHLEIYVERIRREFNVEVEVVPPKVNYREAPTHPPNSTRDTRSKPAARASSPTSWAAWTSCPKTPPKPSCSRTKSRAGGFPSSTSPPWKRVSASDRTRDPWPVFRWWACRSPWKTARITKWTVPTWPSRSVRRRCMRENFSKHQAGAAGAGDEDRDRVPQPIPGAGGRQSDLAPRHGGRYRNGRPHRSHRGRSALGRDLRLLDRPAQHDAGAGHVHDGVLRYRRLPPSLEREVIAQRKKAALAAV